MTGDAVGLPGVAVGSGVGRGVGSGAGADDDGIAEEMRATPIGP